MDRQGFAGMVWQRECRDGEQWHGRHGQAWIGDRSGRQGLAGEAWLGHQRRGASRQLGGETTSTW